MLGSRFVVEEEDEEREKRKRIESEKDGWRGRRVWEKESGGGTRTEDSSGQGVNERGVGS
jgi:hypothetical protein